MSAAPVLFPACSDTPGVAFLWRQRPDNAEIELKLFLLAKYQQQQQQPQQNRRHKVVIKLGEYQSPSHGASATLLSVTLNDAPIVSGWRLFSLVTCESWEVCAPDRDDDAKKAGGGIWLVLKITLEKEDPVAAEWKAFRFAALSAEDRSALFLSEQQLDALARLEFLPIANPFAVPIEQSDTAATAATATTAPDKPAEYLALPDKHREFLDRRAAKCASDLVMNRAHMTTTRRKFEAEDKEPPADEGEDARRRRTVVLALLHAMERCVERQAERLAASPVTVRGLVQALVAEECRKRMMNCAADLETVEDVAFLGVDTPFDDLVRNRNLRAVAPEILANHRDAKSLFDAAMLNLRLSTVEGLGKAVQILRVAAAEYHDPKSVALLFPILQQTQNSTHAMYYALRNAISDSSSGGEKMPLDPAMNRICGEQLVGKVSHVVRLFFIQRAAAWGAPDGLLSLAGIWSAEGGEDLAELGGVPVPEEVRAVFRDEARSQRLAAITASDCGSAQSYLVTCIAAIKRGTEHSAEDDALALHYFDLFTRVTEPQNASRAAPLIAPAQQRQKARQAAAAAGSAPAAMTQAPATTAAATAAAAATPLRYRATRDPMAEFD